MKNKFMILLLCASFMMPSTVSADILDYEGTINAYKQDNKTAQIFEIDNGSGKSVTAVAKTDDGFCLCKGGLYTFQPGKKWEETEESLSGNKGGESCCLRQWME